MSTDTTATQPQVIEVDTGMESIIEQLLSKRLGYRLEIEHTQRPKEEHTLLLSKAKIMAKLKDVLPVTSEFLYTLKKTGSANMVTSEYTINAILRPATKEELQNYFNRGASNEQKAAGAE